MKRPSDGLISAHRHHKGTLQRGDKPLGVTFMLNQDCCQSCSALLPDPAPAVIKFCSLRVTENIPSTQLKEPSPAGAGYLILSLFSLV